MMGTFLQAMRAERLSALQQWGAVKAGDFIQGVGHFPDVWFEVLSIHGKHVTYVMYTKYHEERQVESIWLEDVRRAASRASVLCGSIPIFSRIHTAEGLIKGGVLMAWNKSVRAGGNYWRWEGTLTAIDTDSGEVLKEMSKADMAALKAQMW